MTTMGFRHYESCSRTQVVSVGYEKDTRNPVTMQVCWHTAFSRKEKLAIEVKKSPYKSADDYSYRPLALFLSFSYVLW